MSLSNAENEWFDFTSQFVTKLNDNDNDWKKLDDEEQELASLWKLEMDIHNGGFLQFFTNWGIECYDNAVRCLKKMGAVKCLAIIESSYEIIEKYKEDKRLTTYQDLYDLISEKEMKLIDNLDQQYWALPEDIIALTFKTYDKSKFNNV